MTFTTLISGDKYFPHKDHLNAVHPDHADAQFFIPKHNAHTFIGRGWERNFWKKDDFEDNFPYTLGEDSLRLYQLAVINGLSDDQRFEALIFNFHKVYPPGEKGSPELSEKGLQGFDEKFVQKTRRLIKYNSMLVRKAFGLSTKIDTKILELHRQLQANVLFYLQHKTDEELELMNMPRHTNPMELLHDDEETDVYLLLNGKLSKSLFPSDENCVRRCWWKEFKLLHGGERFEKYGLARYHEVLERNKANHQGDD